ncbi:MAG TPA: hypothetical protein VN457_05045, partial [Chlamydiales bacterium]|nr:hypothetical protein [Chlamydiales bacterium]
MTRQISGVIQSTCNDLKSLVEKIDQGVDMIDPEIMKTIVDKLHKDSNLLSLKISQEIKVGEIGTIDSKLRKDLLDYIERLQHSPDFTQGLGGLQGTFLHTLTEIKSNVEKWRPK